MAVRESRTENQRAIEQTPARPGEEAEHGLAASSGRFLLAFLLAGG
jgi:hypothetical protein